jgi:hypothetical protein
MAKYDPKNTVIQLGERYVQGYSLKTDKVYCTAYTSDAKRFTAEAAQVFLREHCGKDRGIEYKHIILHLIKPGQPFRPYDDDGNLSS